MKHENDPKPWNEIILFYVQSIAAHGPAADAMLEIVRFISSSRYADGMFPCTSHQVLCIRRVRDFAPGEAEVRVQCDETGQIVTFTCAQHGDEKEPWSRSCSILEWKQVFERILHKKLRWFHEG